MLASIERRVRSFDGTDLWVRITGSGDTTLVLCDGLGCDGYIWVHLEPAFRSRYRIIHWNYRGHGRSAPAARRKPITIDDLVGNLIAVLDATDTKQPVLLGHSMGVQVTLELAARQPKRVLALVPMCGSYGRPLETFHGTGRLKFIVPWLRRLARRNQDRSTRLWRRAFNPDLMSRIAMVSGDVNAHLIRRSDMIRYAEHMIQMDPVVFLELLEALGKHSVEDRLPSITHPALVIGGDRDTFTPVWLSERMAERLPDAELLIIPTGSHTAPIEIPELVHLRLERFLDQRVLKGVAGAARRVG